MSCGALSATQAQL